MRNGKRGGGEQNEILGTLLRKRDTIRTKRSQRFIFCAIIGPLCSTLALKNELRPELRLKIEN